jgi:CRP-like cAMP-binding protein
MKISGADFRELLHTTPDLLEDLYWQQADRVRRLSRQVAEIMGRLAQRSRIRDLREDRRIFPHIFVAMSGIRG